MQKRIYNGIAVFDRPIVIDENRILGILFDTRRERFFCEGGADLAHYIAYLVGVEQFLKNGGTINDEKDLWTLPDGEHALLYNGALERLVTVLMLDLVGFRTYEFDRPIAWQEGEIEDSEFVVGQTLIDRYTQASDTK